MGAGRGRHRLLTLDDPNQSANTMNRDYAESMAATIDRLEAEKDSITGVVITSAKKTFFAGGDLNDLRAAGKRRRTAVRGDGPRGQGAAAPPRDARQAGRRRDQRRGARRRPRDRARLPPPRRARRPEGQARLPRGHARTAAGRRRRRAHGAHVRHRRRADEPADAGPGSAPREGARDRARRRGRRRARGARPRREGVDQGAADRRADDAAVGREGLQDARRHAVEPEARAEPAGVPGEPAQAAEGRELPGAAPHHGRGGRGRAGRLRQRDRDRGPLLRGPRDRPGREEHDPGVLLRPAARQRRPRPAGGHRALPARRRRSCSAPA